jgi:hypothetical protein
VEIRGIEEMTAEDLNRELQRGGKFVLFQYCVSVVFMTFRRPTDIYFIRAGESAAGKSAGYTLLSLLAGWWGFPWGPIYTIGSISTNLKGGKDVTDDVIAWLNQHNSPPPSPAGNAG